jgi:hypothetical protein
MGVGLLTGHCYLNGHLFNVGLTNSSRFDRCLCNYEAKSYIRFCDMGHYFMGPSSYHDAPIRKVLRFIRNVGLTEGQSRRGSTVDLRGSSARAR